MRIRIVVSVAVLSVSGAVVSGAPARPADPASVVTKQPQASASVSQPASAIKRSFAVFRRKKTERDTIRPRAKTKRGRAQLAALDSRLVYSSREFKVYLIADPDRGLCIRRLTKGGWGGGCGPVATLLSVHPPVLFTLGSERTTMIPVADGVPAVTRVGSDGSRAALLPRNNIVVDVSPAGYVKELRMDSAFWCPSRTALTRAHSEPRLCGRRRGLRGSEGKAAGGGCPALRPWGALPVAWIAFGYFLSDLT